MNGNRLKQARVLAGHTQVSLGELLNTTGRQVWRWETEEHSPNSNTLYQLAQALGVTSDFLLGLDDNIPLSSTDLSLKEKAVIIAMRQGDKVEAVKIIINE